MKDLKTKKYELNKEVQLEVYVSGDNIYLSQEQMCLLFEKSPSTIRKHIKNSLEEEIIDEFNNQYGNLIIKYNEDFHDRFIFVDRKEIYHLGSSIKDARKKSFAINKMFSKFINDILSRLE